jgi:hypothetical protein
VYLAGLRVPDDDVRELIRLVDEPTRSLLEKSLAFDSGIVALTIEDRERILWAGTFIPPSARSYPCRGRLRRPKPPRIPHTQRKGTLTDRLS